MDNKRLKVAIGADHGGVEAKKVIVDYLHSQGLETDDKGTDTAESCDYPIYAYKVAKDVGAGKADLGILICNSGEGMAIAANKVDNVRAAVLYNEETARLAREHNHANVIAFGAQFFKPEEMVAMVKKYLAAQPLGDRHERRVAEITKIQNGEDPGK